MKSTIATLLLSLVLMAMGVSAFAPVAPANRATSELSMGLFDAFQPKKPAPKSDPNKIDTDVFGGRGKRVTVREDEDNAMWIEDEDTGEKKSPFGGLFGGK
mmetsp:Transcript_21556/g.44987  ORF Transcript_21556/g.44987 Transcript_21556/m.44987 type:complete len:101 (+) Transcript_21556:99-401(+)|eukprot:CAMPEP_0172468224 /NCGR_PEP_ID=MMETSP1065-20121228/60862_1 /TAXON_ID=265537 /ORGANISM="Amphiprora paludosa, Strain CCMP125" /LENGTH=100 /DNA_ID=CAMNT_0013225577 /DNA_START=82 /DNA_END=384 /DNA_ORIENTATION=+